MLSLLNMTFNHGILFFRQNVTFYPTTYSDKSVTLLSESTSIDSVRGMEFYTSAVRNYVNIHKPNNVPSNRAVKGGSFNK